MGSAASWTTNTPSVVYSLRIVTITVLVTALLRAFGLYLLATTAISLPSQIGYLMVPSVDDFGGAVVRASFIGNVVAIAATLLLGWVLYFKTQRVAALIVPNDSAAVVISGGQHLYTAAVGLAGIFIFVTGLEDLAASGTTLFAQRDFETRALMFDGELQNLARGTVSVLFGALLLVGTERIVAWWYAFRGFDKSESDDDSRRS